MRSTTIINGRGSFLFHFCPLTQLSFLHHNTSNSVSDIIVYHINMFNTKYKAKIAIE